MNVCGPNNVGRAVQTDPTLLRYASAITEQKKCWELLAEKFDRFQTLRNNMQQGVQTDATCNIQQCWELLATMLRPFARGFRPKFSNALLYGIVVMFCVFINWDISTFFTTVVDRVVPNKPLTVSLP